MLQVVGALQHRAAAAEAFDDDDTAQQAAGGAADAAAVRALLRATTGRSAPAAQRTLLHHLVPPALMEQFQRIYVTGHSLLSATHLALQEAVGTLGGELPSRKQLAGPLLDSLYAEARTKNRELIHSADGGLLQASMCWNYLPTSSVESWPCWPTADRTIAGSQCQSKGVTLWVFEAQDSDAVVPMPHCPVYSRFGVPQRCMASQVSR